MKSEAAELAGKLALHADALARELFPAGRKDGRDWRVGSLAGEAGSSMCITLYGAKRGVWVDFASGEAGDALDLVAQTLYRGDMPSAMEWARRWLGLPERERERIREQRRPQAVPDSPQETGRAARGLWLRAKPLRAGDPVWRYLEGRGLNIELWRRVPGALRYHPNLWNAESKRTWPAMVAAVCDPQGNLVAVHRTWLEERNLAFEDAPVVTKAPLEEAKRTLGHYRGGCIRLGRGPTGKSWAQMPQGEALMLGEGIEDVLTGMQFWPRLSQGINFPSTPSIRAVCAISLSSMLSVELPSQIETLFLLRQSDPPNSKAALLFKRVTKRFLDQGRRVMIMQYSGVAKDLNEYVNLLGKEGMEEWPRTRRQT